jgi:fructokinase
MRIGVDLGGTKIEVAALDEAGNFKLRERIASPVGDYDATVRAVSDLVTAAERKLARRCTVGLGIPGTISPATGVVKNANSTWLNGRPLDRDLSKALGRDIRIANDANCFALSEAIDGAGKGHRVVFGVILGTGVGGGIVVDGSVLTGPNAIAGEWGHNPLPGSADFQPALAAESQPHKDPTGSRRSQACYCGKRDCVETWLSGPALTRRVTELAGHSTNPSGIAILASNGDPSAEAVLTAYEHDLAAALAQVVNILDPDIIVFGGGLSNLERLYTNVQPLLARHAFSDAISTPIVKNRWGDSGGVRGAAWLWPDP